MEASKPDGQDPTPCPSPDAKINELDTSPAQRGTLPSDDEISRELKRLLEGSDLNVVTPKVLRTSLETHYGVPLSAKKGFIKGIIAAYVRDVERQRSAPEGSEGVSDGGEDASSDEAVTRPKTKRKALFGSLLSPEMAEFLDMEECSRGQVVKKLWEYIKANKLQDPKDGRRIVFDEKFAVLFGDNGKRKSMNMLQMNKLLSRHVKIDDSDVVPRSGGGGGGRGKRVKKAATEVVGEKKSKAPVCVQKSKAPSSGDRSPGGGSAETKKAHPLLELSPEMQAFVGAEKMSKQEIVTRFWDHVKEHELQDPEDRRYILSDDALEHLTGESRFEGFSFMKLVKDHILS